MISFSVCKQKCFNLNIQLAYVDNFIIENEHIVNRFLDFWIGSSYQLVGYLIGEVQLGIKENIVVIYEPSQKSAENSVSFQADSNEEIVDEL
uniref:Uncharacterized protein n=1 Tax=Panagrolaimus davidi TaxID=227884 RepID=A0A914PIA6_9BILA